MMVGCRGEMEEVQLIRATAETQHELYDLKLPEVISRLFHPLRYSLIQSFWVQWTRKEVKWTKLTKSSTKLKKFSLDEEDDYYENTQGERVLFDMY
jgi:hypothetical protein